MDQATRKELQSVVAQITSPSEIIQSAKSSNPEISAEAKQVLDAKYMVVIASSLDQHVAEAIAQQANSNFQARGSKLNAVALPPGHTPFWGVYVGEMVSLTDANSLVQEAKLLGYKDAYLTKF